MYIHIAILKTNPVRVVHNIVSEYSEDVVEINELIHKFSINMPATELRYAFKSAAKFLIESDVGYPSAITAIIPDASGAAESLCYVRAFESKSDIDEIEEDPEYLKMISALEDSITSLDVYVSQADAALTPNSIH